MSYRLKLIMFFRAIVGSLQQTDVGYSPYCDLIMIFLEESAIKSLFKL